MTANKWGQAHRCLAEILGLAEVEEVQSSVLEAQRELTEELQPKFVVGLKVDKDTHAGLVSDIKQELRKANTLKVMYIANARAE